MKELAKERGMTTKELAETLGVDERTIQRAVKDLDFTTVLSESTGGRPTMVFTQEQATAIKQEVQKHHNLASRQIDTVTTEQEENNTIIKAMGILQSRARAYKKRAELAEKRLAITTRERDGLQIELNKSKEWRTIKWMEQKTGKHFQWQELVRASKLVGKEPKKVFDANYGRLNAYHIDAWEKAYGDAVASKISGR